MSFGGVGAHQDLACPCGRGSLKLSPRIGVRENQLVHVAVNYTCLDEEDEEEEGEAGMLDTSD